jgi:hypothetical protein
MLRIPTKYAALLIGIFTLFVYLMATEGVDRVSSLRSSYNEYRSEEASILTPEQIEEERSSLIAREKFLGRPPGDPKAAFSPSETGVLDYLSTNSTKAGLSLMQLVPHFNEAEDGIREFRFSLTVRGGYHGFGRFVNAIETGVFPARIEHIAIEKSERARQLKMVISGSVTVLESLQKGG